MSVRIHSIPKYLLYLRLIAKTKELIKKVRYSCLRASLIREDLSFSDEKDIYSEQFH